MSLSSDMRFLHGLAHSANNMQRKDVSDKALLDQNAMVFRDAMLDMGVPVSELQNAKTIHSVIEWLAMQVGEAIRSLSTDDTPQSEVVSFATWETIECIRWALLEEFGDQAPKDLIDHENCE